MKKIDINNGKTTLQLTVYAIEKKESIILLHGGPGAPEDFPEIVEILEKKFRVINFDQRGTGNSFCKDGDYSMEAYISDIDAIANHFNLDTFHLWGHSWGGLYAQIYAQARKNRLKSLFLSSPSSGTGEDWKQTEKEVLEYNKNAASQGEWLMMGINSLLGLFGSDKAYQRMYLQVVKNYHKGYNTPDLDIHYFHKVKAAPTNKTRKYIANYPELQIMEQADFPIIVTYGDNDLYGPSAQKVQERYPTAQFITIPNAGHIPWAHNPTVYEACLKDFYSKY